MSTQPGIQFDFVLKKYVPIAAVSTSCSRARQSISSRMHAHKTKSSFISSFSNHDEFGFEIQIFNLVKLGEFFYDYPCLPFLTGRLPRSEAVQEAPGEHHGAK